MIHQINNFEAVYIVGAIRVALDHPREGWTERDVEVLKAIMYRLAAPMDLSTEIINEIEK